MWSVMAVLRQAGVVKHLKGGGWAGEALREGRQGEQGLHSLAWKVLSLGNCHLMLGFVPASCQSRCLHWISGSRGEECIKQR